jgi:hypothetical protein
VGLAGQLIGLVVPLNGERTKLRLMAATMVAAENQLASVREHRADVGLSAAAVAAVDGPKWAEDCSGHGAPLEGRSDLTTMKTGVHPPCTIQAGGFADSEAVDLTGCGPRRATPKLSPPPTSLAPRE